MLTRKSDAAVIGVFKAGLKQLFYAEAMANELIRLKGAKNEP